MLGDTAVIFEGIRSVFEGKLQRVRDVALVCLWGTRSLPVGYPQCV